MYHVTQIANLRYGSTNASTARAVRIVHTINSLRADHGGPSRSVPELCSALAHLGMDVRIVTQKDGDDAGSASVRPGAVVPVTFAPRQASLPAFLPSLSRIASALKREIAEQQTTDHGEPTHPLIHDHGLWMPSNHVAAAVARSLNCSLIVCTLGMLTKWALDRKRLKKQLAWRVYQRRDLSGVAVLHATSAGELEDIRRMGLRQPVAVIANGVTVPHEWKQHPSQGPQRQALFLSRLHPVKGVMNLIEAWARARPEGWTLALVGPSRHRFHDKVMEAVRKSGMERVITISGPATDAEKWAAFRDADLFILPSESESFGMAIAEALASGVPVITTKAAPWAEIQSRRCGWWVDTGAESLATAIKEATGLSDERRTEMGRRGRALIVEKYAWNRAAKEMAHVYRWLYRREPRPETVFT